MARRVGKCTNYSACKLADQKERISVVTNEFRCPECGSPLEAVARIPSLWHFILAIALIAGLTIVGTLIYLQRGPRLEEQSTEIATLSILTEPPGASILLDGKPPQSPPNTFTHVPFGTHQLTATLDNYESIKQDLQVHSGLSPEIHLKLTQKQEIPALAILTDPPGASILLDGNAPQSPGTFTHVPFGTHRLTASLNDYEAIKQDIEVRKGMTPEIHLKLKPSQEIAALSVQTDPPGAAILLDGRPPQSPNTFAHVPFGTHLLTAALDNYEPIKQDIEVRSGMAPEVRLKLKQKEPHPSETPIILDFGFEMPNPIERDEFNLLNQQVQTLFKQGKYQEAVPLAKKAVELALQLFELYSARHQYAEADKVLQEAGWISQNVLGPEPGDIRKGAPNTATPSPTPPPILPTFFPPKATATVELPINRSVGTLTLAHLSDMISKAMDEAGYERRSYFWLDKEHAPGFAIITHIEQIHADGTPVTRGRWSFDLPSYEHFSIASFLKAMIKADPGNYRMIALVVSQVPFEEKKEPITQDQVAALNAGPKFLARTADSQVTVTQDYHCIAYVYEFERRTRNDDPVFKDSSDVSASAHLKSTPLWGALMQLR